MGELEFWTLILNLSFEFELWTQISNLNFEILNRKFKYWIQIHDL